MVSPDATFDVIPSHGVVNYLGYFAVFDDGEKGASSPAVKVTSKGHAGHGKQKLDGWVVIRSLESELSVQCPVPLPVDRINAVTNDLYVIHLADSGLV